ncbi:MAG TPA: rhomboid family intramembrane serine protease [Candidatus Acidoferrum sp.]|nr:rhomboid family intramembrane serine protease [Candidatus Acidoferrum sp.]
MRTDATGAPVVSEALPARESSSTLSIAIIAINVLVFAVMVIKGVSFMSPTADSVLKWGADYGPLTLRGQWWRMFTSMFLHFGIIHLVFNMVVLANVGPFMESLMGRAAYLILYVVAGLGGGALSLAYHPWTVSAGASGAIFGLYGGLLGFLLLHRNVIAPAVLKSQTNSALIFVGYNVIYGFARPNVDVAAHIGGLAAGFVLGLFLVPPLTRESQATQGSRNAAAILLGVALVAVPLFALPKPDDFDAEVKRMANMEDKAIDLFQSSMKNWKANQLTDQQFEDVLEKQIIPPWRAEREAMQKLKHLSKEQTPVAETLLQYMTAREDGWEFLVDGVRTNDTDKIKKYNEKSDEAERLARSLGGGDKK